MTINDLQHLSNLEALRYLATRFEHREILKTANRNMWITAASRFESRLNVLLNCEVFHA